MHAQSKIHAPSVLTAVVALTIVVALIGFFVSGGYLPNFNSGLSLITTGLETSELSTSLTSVHVPPSDIGIMDGKVLGPTGLPAIGASVIAHKELGVINSAVKEGGFTANSFVTVDGTYSLKMPSGIYRITVAFPDGSNQIIENYAIWPSSSSSYDFKYVTSPSL
jgi:hypothetical protein